MTKASTKAEVVRDLKYVKNVVNDMTAELFMKDDEIRKLKYELANAKKVQEGLELSLSSLQFRYTRVSGAVIALGSAEVLKELEQVAHVC
jgi:predicted RNase H-like nuclease (RuvC/YqgF family)